ncbi:glycosyltransferase [Nostoc sp.]
MPSYNEGFPLAMLEVMAWELPVIVTMRGRYP